MQFAPSLAATFAAFTVLLTTTASALPPAASARHDHQTVYPYPGFIYQAKSELHLNFAESNVSTTVQFPGQLLTRNETTALPELGVDHHFARSHHEGSKYVYLYVDPSIYGTNGSVVALHALVANVTLSCATLDGQLVNLTYDADDVVAAYMQPTPYLGADVHTYIQLLFTQPEGWTFPPAYANILPPTPVTNRLGLDLAKFVHAAGLSTPVAATYYNMSKIPKPSSI